MTTSNTITKTDLTNILNEVLPTTHYGSIYRASWTASSSSANGTPLTGDITIPAGTYVVNCISPIASANVSIAIAGRYNEMIKNGDSFTIIYSCNDTVTFHVSSAQSTSVTFSYTERGSLTAIQISEQGVATNVADYIVEQGTDGIWTYRKWNSGVAECWGIYESAITGTTSWGSIYYTTIKTVSFPTSLFIERPSCSITSIGNNIQGWGTSNRCTKDEIDVFLMRPTSASDGTPILTLHAIGRWK